MRLRKLLLATSAVVAAGVMAIAPSAMATPNHVDVPGNLDGSYTINLVATSVSVSIALYGIPTSITCTSGAASGTVDDNYVLPPNLPLPPNAISALISSMMVTCPSIFPGTTVTMSQVCAIPYVANSAYTAALTDTVVGQTDLTSAGGDCVMANISNGCSFRVGGSPASTFDEITQRLAINGTAVIHNVSGCLGAVSNNQTFTINALFNVAVNAPNLPRKINILP